MSNTDHAKIILTKHLPPEAYKYLGEMLEALNTTGLLNNGTMDKIEWNTDIHRGMAAIDEDGETWIMQSEEDDIINLIHPKTLAYVWGYKKNLAPTGERHHFTPESDRPATLKTVKDYEGAPIGTIAAIESLSPITKEEYGWERPDGEMLTNEEAAEHAIAERKILRWGKKKGC